MNDIPPRGGAARPGSDLLPRVFITCFAVLEVIGLLLLVIHLVRRR